MNYIKRGHVHCGMIGIMGNVIWFMIMIPCSILFTVLGIYAWKRKKPMWFWSGSTVREEEISDVPAYNRANGIMWICFSLVFWVSTIMGFREMTAAGIVLIAGCLGGVPLLVICYDRIYRKYRTKRDGSSGVNAAADSKKKGI